MAGVTIELGRAAFVDVVTVVLALVATVVLLRYRVNSAWLVVAGALFGIVYKGLLG
jgi:chromate transporter